MAKASDNKFPYLHLVPAAAPASPAAGTERLYLDSADGNKLKRKNPAGVVTTIEGGGSGSSIKDLRWTPGPGAVTVDEFNDGILDAAWGRVDGANAPAGNVTWTEGGDVLSANYTTGTDTGNASHAMLRPLSGAGGAMATGDAFVTCMNVLGPWNTNNSIGGLMLADGNTYGAGLQIAGELGQGIGMLNNLRKYTGYTTDSGGTVEAILATTQPLFARVVYLGSSNWRFDRSADGVSWIKGTVLNYASFTPTYVGFTIRQGGTSAKLFSVSVDFLRRVAGVS